MESMAKSSSAWMQAFADLSCRLADKDITTHSLRAEWGSFGSWQLIVAKMGEAVRFTYDGRDSFLTVESSPIRDHSAPNQWKEHLVKGMDNMNNEVIEFCESFLTNKFPTV